MAGDGEAEREDDGIPAFLRRPQPEPVVQCNHCGQPATPADPLNPYD